MPDWPVLNPLRALGLGKRELLFVLGLYGEPFCFDLFLLRFTLPYSDYGLELFLLLSTGLRLRLLPRVFILGIRLGF